MISAILLAGGSGTRAGNGIPKQLIKINGIPMIEYSVRIVQKIKGIDFFIVVVRETDKNYVKDICNNYSKFKGMVIGGETRQQSVFAGLKKIMKKNVEKVLIHDTARPFSGNVFKNVLAGLEGHESSIPVVEVKDSLCKVVKNECWEKTEYVDRNDYFKVQTPQGFEYEKIYSAHVKAFENSKNDYSDDGSLFAVYFGNLNLVKGDVENIKITYPLELEIAEKIAVKGK